MTPSPLLLALLVAASTVAADRPANLPPDYKLLYEERFDDTDALGRFVMTDPTAWKLSEGKEGNALELASQSSYKPKVRSPINIALIRHARFRDFVLEADLIQTGREYGHRDMCLFFGFQSPTQFYYAHIATSADPNAHNVFIVKDAPRKNFAEKTTKGVNWGLGVWHKVRLERTASNGSIRVFFDDMTTPIMVANDRTFEDGYIGFGSFDDTGKIDNVRIWGSALEEKPAEFFKTD